MLKRLLAGDRAALAKSMTLIESTLPAHKQQASELLKQLPSIQNSTRIGLSGGAGVGKSSFVEAFGMHLISKGHKVAVLAVDPSSAATGGSILGDKTRMYELAMNDNAFIRPSPTSGTLGGVARTTMESIMLCEAAGYSHVIVETVGVGQSETMVADICDVFALLVGPSTGDELQGIKKGIMERADIVVVNKCDLPGAKITALEYVSALKFSRPKKLDWKPPVVLASALTGEGVPKVWSTMQEFMELSDSAGHKQELRLKQQKKWMWRLVVEDIELRIKSSVQYKEWEKKLANNECTPGQAADAILKQF